MPRSIAGSSLSRYASTDFESQPDPAFEGVNTDDLTPEQIIEETMKLMQEKSKVEKEIGIFDNYCETFEIPGKFDRIFNAYDCRVCNADSTYQTTSIL